MAATSSTMPALGSNAPTFILPDVCRDDQPVALADFVGQPMLMMFICNHCPFVIHIVDSLAKLANVYQQLGYAVVAISSNDVASYPQDGPELMRKFAATHGFEFPYCYDQSQQVARDYGAACTPDFFIYDSSHALRYRGQLDASRPGNRVPVSGQDLREALDAVLKGTLPNDQQTPSVGCSIKWKRG